MRKEIRLAQLNKAGVHVIFLDLDRFKIINDTFGHEAGDKLLVETARRLEETLDKNCTIARFGGDEFLILMPGLGDQVPFYKSFNKLRFRFRNLCIMRKKNCMSLSVWGQYVSERWQ